MALRNINPRNLAPLHEVRDAAKLAALTASMAKDGWWGRPLLALGEDAPTLLTGSHRLAAALAADLDEIPVYCINTEEHTVGDDGNCVACGEAECWTEMAAEARDEGDRLNAVLLSGDAEAIALMRAEIEQ